MKKSILIILLVALMLLPLAAQGKSEAEADQQYVLRFGHVQTPEDTFNKQYLEWSKAVSERTNGKLKIEVYPSGAGVEEDVRADSIGNQRWLADRPGPPW